MSMTFLARRGSLLAALILSGCLSLGEADPAYTMTMASEACRASAAMRVTRSDELTFAQSDVKRAAYNKYYVTCMAESGYTVPDSAF